jgi:ribose transport system substrate-binding protein
MNINFRRFAFLLIAALFVLSLGAVAAQDEDGEPIVIGYSPAVYDSTDYFGQFDQGLRDALDEAGIDYEIRGRAPLQESDLAGHMSIVEDFVTLGVDYIIFGPTDPVAVVPAIQAANEAGIPVIINNHLDPLPEDADAEVLSYAGYSHLTGGTITGQYIVDNLVGEGDQAAILFGQPGAAASAERGEPAREIMEAAGVAIVYEQPANWQRERAFDATERLLISNPDVDLIYAVNSSMAMGAAEAVAAAGRDDIDVLGFGSVIAEIDMIWEGLISASIFRDAYSSGQQGAEAIIRHLNGEEVPLQYELSMIMLGSREDILDFVPVAQLELTTNWLEMREALIERGDLEAEADEG